MTDTTRRCIVVVEDNSDLRLELAELLREHGYEVLEAVDGAAALALLNADAAVDLILLDLWLPRVDGWTFRVRQRGDPRNAHIPVIVLTADASSRAQAIDAACVLSKPCDADTLLETVRDILARPRTPPGAGELLRGTTKLLAEALGHELANPLAILIHSLEHARDSGKGNGGGPERLHVNELLEQCWRMVETLRRLRDLTAPPSRVAHAVDLVRVLTAAVAATVGAGVSLTVPARAPHVAADEQVLNYVLRAVLRNAAESVGQKEDSDEPVVRVRVTHTRDWVTVEIRDRGPLIPEDELPIVFTPEYPGRGNSWSTGLRLWFVRDALGALGGSVEISNDETGVLCALRIPVAPVPS
jgi:CheY-like chemotaxis protein